jgi:hypothetical protein
MQRVRQATVGHRAPGRVQGLRRHLAAVEPASPVEDSAAAVDVLLDVLEIQQI